MNLKFLLLFAKLSGIMLMFMLSARYLATTAEIESILFKGIGFFLIVLILIINMPYEFNIVEKKENEQI